ncbi:MAG: HAMP domain-containing histidine kinase [Myxococcales bacterium FL481]|nr:MAG: HAMP domain-containing histidine kinase [Myxococcales bacterium FL481]
MNRRRPGDPPTWGAPSRWEHCRHPRPGSARRRRHWAVNPPPGGWRFAHYVNAHLHRRLFVGFGVAIAVSTAVGWGVYHFALPHPRALMVATGVGALSLWGIAGGVARRMTLPLLELMKVTRDLGAGKLDSRMGLGRFSGGEIGMLARSVNDMAQRIEQQLADQRELLAAVSHELRTPLGHMRVLIDTAKDGAEDHAHLDELEREVLEIDRLVDQLLATSRVDFGQLASQPVDLAELAVRALERLGVDATRLDVETDATTVQGDPTLLLAAMTNVLQNAVVHGGGVSTVKLESRERELCFEVWDDGPGFKPEDLEHVFESFYRGRHRAGGSLGLGLALVRRIADAHGGRVWAQSRETRGAVVGFSVHRGRRPQPQR